LDETVLDFRRRAAAVDGSEALNASFRAVAAQFGFSDYAGGQLEPYDPKKPFLLYNWPKTWLELCAAQGFATDDVAVREALRSPEPFTWTEIQARFPGVSARIFAACTEFGWTEGFVVPVHGPGAARGVVSLAGSGPLLAGPARHAMEAIALSAYERARELGDGRASATESFTRREQEVLALIAAGHNDGEIAAALGVSKTTAHFHAENTRRKLGAATRAHAVALAITRGVVRL
jgi:LuxR family quorum sensing-dependent transcriptional regulator